MEFQVGHKVMLKVSPWKGTVRFGKRGKLSPRYTGPFEILARIGPCFDILDCVFTIAREAGCKEEQDEVDRRWSWRRSIDRPKQSCRRSTDPDEVAEARK
ncbi:hypothetical protein E3N88_07114 [Mikania micrantha]|uniref:Tf2-1-like SH3-like domain-containing protein n=1 Tax=Mikania micrantha TaxID=192012 RepID=A0A5N6PQN6_9ASTR|nr:hypothetical protein E3N88_07114 [Mikania micrantha]